MQKGVSIGRCNGFTKCWNRCSTTPVSVAQQAPISMISISSAGIEPSSEQVASRSTTKIFFTIRSILMGIYGLTIWKAVKGRKGAGAARSRRRGLGPPGGRSEPLTAFQINHAQGIGAGVPPAPDATRRERGVGAEPQHSIHSGSLICHQSFSDIFDRSIASLNAAFMRVRCPAPWLLNQAKTSASILIVTDVLSGLNRAGSAETFVSIWEFFFITVKYRKKPFSTVIYGITDS